MNRLSKPTLRLTALAAALLVVTIAGLSCGSDDSTSPSGSTSSNPLLSVPAGTYTSAFTLWDCGDPKPPAETETAYFCDTEVVDEFADFPCPIRATGANSLSINCTLRNVDFGRGCEGDVTINGTGTRGGGVWSLTGTVLFANLDPPDCFPDSCLEFETTLTSIGGRADMCDFANENEFDVTITGGQFSGARILEASGNQTFSSGPPYAFDIIADFNPNEAVVAKRQLFCFEPLCLTIQTAPMDPANLPITLDVVAQPNGGIDDAIVEFNENEFAAPPRFTSDTAISGQIVVENLSADYIAGTLNMTLEGDRFDGTSTTRAQRSVSGGFFVLNETIINKVSPNEELVATLLRKVWGSAIGQVEASHN